MALVTPTVRDDNAQGDIPTSVGHLYWYGKPYHKGRFPLPSPVAP